MKQFLSHVEVAVGVFKRQVELVVFLQPVEARLRIAPGTLQIAARTVNIHVNVSANSRN